MAAAAAVERLAVARLVAAAVEWKPVGRFLAVVVAAAAAASPFVGVPKYVACEAQNRKTN